MCSCSVETLSGELGYCGEMQSCDAGAPEMKVFAAAARRAESFVGQPRPVDSYLGAFVGSEDARSPPISSADTETFTGIYVVAGLAALIAITAVVVVRNRFNSSQDHFKISDMDSFDR